MSPMSTTTFIKRVLGPARPSTTTRRRSRCATRSPQTPSALERLAQLDSRHAPRGAVLVAEVGGELWAAISIDDRRAIADPFRPTGELVALLEERARQLRRSQRRRRHGLPRLWPDTGYDRAAIG